MSRPPLPTAVVFCLAALAAGAAAFAAGPQAAGPVAAPSDAERLAAALATSPSRLAEVVRGDERLPDGRVLTSIKALDLASGDIVGRSFVAGQPVDADAVRSQADALWRFAHGAQSPALVQRLQALAPQDRLVVDLWYDFTPPDDGGGPTGGVEQAPDTGLDAGPAQAAIRLGEDGKIEHLPEPPSRPGASRPSWSAPRPAPRRWSLPIPASRPTTSSTSTPRHSARPRRCRRWPPSRPPTRNASGSCARRWRRCAPPWSSAWSMPAGPSSMPASWCRRSSPRPAGCRSRPRRAGPASA